MTDQDKTALLSKLRAAVADERAAFEVAWRELNAPWPMNSRMHDDGRYATPDIEREWRLWQARAALASAPVADERQAVAYLDLGAGGYMDVGTDLTDEQLAALPKGRHMLAIIGTHGVDGYTPASAPVAPAPDGFVPVAASVLRTLAEPGLIKRTLGKFSPALAAKLGFTPEEEKAIEAMYLAFGESFDYPCAPLASAPVAGEAGELLRALVNLHAVARVDCDEDYAAVSNAAGIIAKHAAPQASTVSGEAKPSDQEILALAAKHSARLRTDNMISFARDLLSRYAAPQASKAVRDADHPVFTFLLGEGPLRGVEFGDRHPDERGAYWWRKDLRAALSAQPGAQRTGGSDA